MTETKWIRLATISDRFALPFWVILIVYGVYEIGSGTILGLIPLVIGAGALIIDTIFVIKNRGIR